MRISDRLARLEIRGEDDAARRRAVEADAADFVRQIERLAARVDNSTSTAADFMQAIRAGGDVHLIGIFAGEDTYAHC